jgi:hypothetical protein
VVAVAIPLLILGLPITDTLVAIIRRWRGRRSIFAGDCHHIHHQLLRIGLSHRQVVIILYLACLLLGAAALTVTALRNEISARVVVAVAALIGGSVHWLGRISMKRKAARPADSPPPAPADDPEDDPATRHVWRRLTGVFPTLDIDQAVLSLAADRRRPAAARTFCWRHRRGNGPADAQEAAANAGRNWVQCFRIVHRNGEAGMLVLQRKRAAGSLPDVRGILESINRQLGEHSEADPLPAADVQDAR